MTRILRRIAGRLPKRWQQELKRLYFGGRLRTHRFRTEEPEYDLLPEIVSPGDWALDVGANVGHYTARLSELVGASGRVVSFEPVPETFELLTANVALLPNKNVTLINAAASEASGMVGMEIPRLDDTGLDNYYGARVSDAPSGFTVLCVAIDSLNLARPIRLVKIDAEGHELPILMGMRRLLDRDHPTLIVEDNSADVADYLAGLGYSHSRIEGSSNQVFRLALRSEAPG